MAPVTALQGTHALPLSNGQASPHFDVFNQTFDLTAEDGLTPWPTNTDDINKVRNLAVRTAIIFAFQLGASVMLLFVLLVMTTSMKRRSLAFIFNVLALLCNVVRCTIMCIEMTGVFMDFVLVIMQVYNADGIREAIRLSVANSVMTTLVFVFIQFALITQVHVVAMAAPQLHRQAIMGFCGLVSALAIGFRLNLMIVNCKNTTNVDGLSKEGIRAQNWAQSTSNICGIVSICVFSLVFCAKLAMAIRSRRQMGLKQFGAMQIIFIMGCQTLTIPVIFAILDYYALRGSQLGSFVETLVAIFLPLSSMWASTNVNSKHIAMPVNNGGHHRAIPVGHFDFTAGEDSYSSKKKLIDIDTADTLIGGTPNSSCHQSPTMSEPRNEPRVSVTAGHRESYISDADDLEMQKIGNNIQVDRSYTVRSDPGAEVGRAR